MLVKVVEGEDDATVSLRAVGNGSIVAFRTGMVNLYFWSSCDTG